MTVAHLLPMSDELIDQIAPFVQRVARETIATQGGKSSQPIWRPADCLVAARPGGVTELHIDGDGPGMRTSAVNGSSVLIVPGNRVLTLLVEPHGIWVQGVIGTDVQAPYIGAYRERNAAISLGSSVTPTVIDMGPPDVVYDPYGYWVSDTQLVIPAGLSARYLIVAKVAFNADPTGARRILIDLNGTQTLWDVSVGAASGTATKPQVTGSIDLAQDDIIEIHVAQNSGGALDVSDRIVSIDLLAPL